MTSAFDLQSHSVHSDGALAAAQVVALAAQAGVELLALTDHDTVDGVDEALQAAGRHGMRLSPAAEISALDPGHVDVHVLGYELDHRDARLRERLAAYRADRDARAERMLTALREQGLALDLRPIERRRRAGDPVGRPHLAAAVFAARENAERLREEGLEDPSDVLEAYLVEGAPAFSHRTTPSVPEAIAAIHDAGGVAVWAHPFWDVTADEEALATLDRYVAAGLDGVEAFYATHSRAQTLLLADAAAERDLLTTGSSDFHGPEHRHFARFRAFERHGREARLGRIGGGG